MTKELGKALNALRTADLDAGKPAKTIRVRACVAVGPDGQSYVVSGRRDLKGNFSSSFDDLLEPIPVVVVEFEVPLDCEPETVKAEVVG